MFSMCLIESRKMKRRTTGKGRLEITGVAASSGIAIGRAHVLTSHAFALTGVTLKTEQEVGQELKKFERAVQASVDEVEAIKREFSFPRHVNRMRVRSGICFRGPSRCRQTAR